MDTLALSIIPSCYNCLSWSDDGELAVAAGEYVHIFTPKTVEDGGSRQATGSWNTTRFRINSFTNKEWPLLYAQDRNSFSIGREQSTSHVIGLAWSPPGLAKYRRCLLAVLTANLLLSLYEGVDDKWERVAIVNHDLASIFSVFIRDNALALRKSSVRSFAWCPPLKTPPADDSTIPYSVPEPECRWGLYFLSLTNDDNDMICLQVRRGTTANRYSTETKCLSSLHDLDGIYPGPLPSSLLSAALKSGVRASSMACGPWFSNNKPEVVYSATALAGVVYGTKLKVIRLDVTLKRSEAEMETYTSSAVSTDFASMPTELTPKHHFTGPLQWYPTGSQEVCLATGVFAGLVVISIPLDVYTGKTDNKDTIETQEASFYGNSIGEMQVPGRHWEPIGAMTATMDEHSQKSTVHLGTTGGYTLAKRFPNPGDSVAAAPWRHRFDELRDTFDINHDLGGLAIGRIWGLASHRGVIATAVTLHPGDMVDYRSAANELTSITFSPVCYGEGLPTVHAMAWDRSPATMQARRERVIGFVLYAGQEKDGDTWCRRVVYAAACCAIIESENEFLRTQARAALKNLATATGADLNEEIEKCSTAPSPVAPKTAEQLNGAGGELFEKCDICNAGMSWYAAQESQCAAGHVFVRCNLTFLSIQEPGISKICSECGAEYLSEDLIGPTHMYGMISDAFDTCIYCDGKFHD